MAQEDWKSVIIVLVMSFLVLHFFVNVKVENKAFEIGKEHVKYHANWTNSFDDLKNVEQLQKAYSIRGIKTLDLSFSMSSLNQEEIKQLLPIQFQVYQTIKINLANNPIGTAGADFVLSLIPNGV